MSPIHFRKQAATDSTKPDLNIGVSPGFGGLIQGQIYNPVSPTIMVEWKTHTFWRQATCFFSGPGISPEPEWLREVSVRTQPRQLWGISLLSFGGLYEWQVSPAIATELAHWQGRSMYFPFLYFWAIFRTTRTLKVLGSLRGWWLQKSQTTTWDSLKPCYVAPGVGFLLPSIVLSIQCLSIDFLDSLGNFCMKRDCYLKGSPERSQKKRRYHRL